MRAVRTEQIMGFHYLSSDIGWVAVEIERGLVLRYVATASAVARIEDLWLYDYILAGAEDQWLSLS